MFPRTVETESAVIADNLQPNGDEQIALIEATALSSDETYSQVVDSLLEPERYREQLWSSTPADGLEAAQRTLYGIWENGHGPVFVAAAHQGNEYEPIGYEYTYRPCLDFDIPERWPKMQTFREGVLTAQDEYDWDVQFVDHLAVAEQYRDRGIGQRVAAVRQKTAEEGWDTGTDTLPVEELGVDTIATRNGYGDPDLIVSLIRTHDDRDTAVAHITEKLGFRDLGVRSREGRYKGVYKARPTVPDRTVEHHFEEVAAHYNL